MDNNYCVIMAGGFSNRFWPLTRENRPRQFLTMPGFEESFIQAMYRRCLRVAPKENVLVVTLRKHKELVREQLPGLPPENLLLEPYSRNTAPCIAYATYVILRRNPAAAILFTPSDLLIMNEEGFTKKLRKSLEYVSRNEVLLTLGVVPVRPDPNFGYIQIAGGKQAAENTGAPIKVKTFTEKPDVELAKVFCHSGEFYWNSGIFLWKASVIREELERYVPEVTNLFEGWEGALGSPAEEVFIERAYTDCPKLSIDYGVMEKTERAWLCPVDFGWADIDNWYTMYDNLPGKDGQENLCYAAHSYLRDARRNILISTDKDKLIAIDGLEDFVVVDTGDVLLICPKDDRKYREFIAATGMPDFERYK